MIRRIRGLDFHLRPFGTSGIPRHARHSPGFPAGRGCRTDASLYFHDGILAEDKNNLTLPQSLPSRAGRKIAEDTGILHQHVAQSRIAAPFSLVADQIFFAEVFSFDDYIIHRRWEMGDKRLG